MAKISKYHTKDTDDTVKELINIFEYAYNAALPDLSRMEEFQSMYDNKANEMTWPTNSKMPIPYLFTMVEKALPAAMDYLFPENKFIRLTPVDEDVDMKRVRRAEWALQHTVKSRMRLFSAAYPTIKNCFKLSLGYGIVEVIKVTPPASYVAKAFSNGKQIESSRIMGLGSPIMTIRYRDLTPGQVIATPDGNDFNGHSAVSWSFLVDLYTEDDFRALYKDEADSEVIKLSGNPDDIIKEADSMGFNCRVPIVNFVAALGGIDLRQVTSKKAQGLPAVIPVLKCYSKFHHVWIANGTKKIFDQKDGFQTMRCPMVKCTAWPDGMRWYPMSPVEAAQKMNLGANVFVNAMFDLMTHYVKPQRVYNSEATGGRAPENGPGADIAVSGTDNVQNVLGYVSPPPMPQQLFEFGRMMDSMYGQAVGQESFASDPKPGLMRGGGGAFESLLQQATSRERLAGAILETNFLENVIAQTLILMQSNIGDSRDVYRLRDWDARSGDEVIKTMTVTQDDLVHAYELELDLKSKHRNGAIDQSMRQQEFNALKGDPMIDQFELYSDFIGSETRARRLIKPREVTKAIEAQDRQLNVQERQLGIASAQPEQPQATMGEQALAGAANMGGAL